MGVGREGKEGFNSPPMHQKSLQFAQVTNRNLKYNSTIRSLHHSNVAIPPQNYILPDQIVPLVNGIYYPEKEYDSDSKVRIFNDLMAYAMTKNDYNTGTQLN